MKIELHGVVFYRDEIEMTADLLAEGDTLEALLEDAEYVFVDQAGNVLSREKAQDQRAISFITDKWMAKHTHINRPQLRLVQPGDLK